MPPDPFAGPRSLADFGGGGDIISQAFARDSSQVQEDFEPAIFDVRIARLSSTTVPAFVNRNGGVLLPLDRVLAATGLPVDRDGDSRGIPGVRGVPRVVLDMPNRTIRRSLGDVPLTADEVVIRDGEAYLYSARIADFLQAQVAVDFGGLTATITRTPPFPAELELALQNRRSRALLGGRSLSGAESAPYVARTGGGVFDWSVSTVGDDPLGSASYNGRLGLAIRGGQLTLGGTYLGGDVSAADRFRGDWSYSRAFPTATLVRQMQVGDIIGGTALARSIRGASITNATQVRAAYYSDVPLAPHIPQGWEYEVYQDGQLLGFSDASSHTPVSVALRYGSTPIQVRLISPSGEERVSDFLYQVPPSQLAPGRFEYHAGGGKCVAESCHGFGFLDMQYGTLQWLTLQAGADALSDSSWHVEPEAGAYVASFSGITGNLTSARHQYTRAAVGYSGPSRASADVSVGRNEPDARQLAFTDTTRARWYADGRLGLRDLAFAPWARAFRIENRMEGSVGRAADLLRSAFYTDFYRATLGLGYERDRSGGRPDLVRLSALAILPDRGPNVFRNAPITVLVGADRTGTRSVEANSSLHVGGQAATLGLVGRWDADLGSSGALTYTRSLGFARTSTRATASRGNTNTATTLSGGLVFDARSGSVTTYAQGGVGAAGVMGRVFYDVDGDGEYSAADRPAAQVPVYVGGARILTAKDGSYHAWNVVPYEITDVAVDTVAVIDPAWVAPKAREVERLTPHLYAVVNFPLVHARELAGTLLPDSGVGVPAGVTVTITEIGTGRSTSVLTFSDGAFYFSRVTPGDYALSIASSALDVLRARVEPAVIHFNVPLEGDAPGIELPPVQLRRRDP